MNLRSTRPMMCSLPPAHRAISTCLYTHASKRQQQQENNFNIPPEPSDSLATDRLSLSSSLSEPLLFFFGFDFVEDEDDFFFGGGERREDDFLTGALFRFFDFGLSESSESTSENSSEISLSTSSSSESSSIKSSSSSESTYRIS